MSRTKASVSRDTLPKTKKAKSETEHEDVLHEVMEMVDACFKYTKTQKETWNRDVKLYNNERVKKNYEGLADTFVPMTFSTLETIKAALVTGDLSIKYQPQDIYKYLVDKFTNGREFESELEKQSFLVQTIKETIDGGVIQDKELEALNALVAYWWDVGDYDERIESLIDSGLKIGTGALMLTWSVDRPILTYVPFGDYIFDPSATSDETGSYVGRRYLSTKKKLEDEKILDPIKRELVPRYSNTSKINEGEKDGEKIDKELKEEMLSGSTLVDNSDQVEVIEIYTEEKLYTLANRKTVIEVADNPIYAQAKLLEKDIERDLFLPGITWANYKDPSLLVGKSETSTFWKEQERLNDATNQKSDAVTNALLQNNRIDPKYSKLAKLLGVPGSTIAVPGGAVERLPQAQVPNAAFNEEASIKSNIRETTATDQIVKGVGSSQDITATEANLQVANADSRIKLKAKSLERRPLKRIARLLYAYVRLFITDPMLIPTETNQGTQPVLFDPKKYTQDFMPKVQLTINAKAAKRAEQNTALEMYQVLIQDPTNNLKAVKEVYLPKITDIDKSELESIINTPEPAAPPQMGMNPEALPPEEMAVAQSMPPMPQGVMA